MNIKNCEPLNITKQHAIGLKALDKANSNILLNVKYLNEIELREMVNALSVKYPQINPDDEELIFNFDENTSVGLLKTFINDFFDYLIDLERDKINDNVSICEANKIILNELYDITRSKLDDVDDYSLDIIIKYKGSSSKRQKVQKDYQPEIKKITEVKEIILNRLIKQYQSKYLTNLIKDVRNNKNPEAFNILISNIYSPTYLEQNTKLKDILESDTDDDLKLYSMAKHYLNEYSNYFFEKHKNTEFVNLYYSMYNYFESLKTLKNNAVEQGNLAEMKELAKKELDKDKLLKLIEYVEVSDKTEEILSHLYLINSICSYHFDGNVQTIYYEYMRMYNELGYSLHKKEFENFYLDNCENIKISISDFSYLFDRIHESNSYEQQVQKHFNSPKHSEI